MATTAAAPPYVSTQEPSTTGIWSWLTTVDHKRIGVLYLVTALCFFLIGGLEAEIIRAQLMHPNGTVVSADTFNQLFTMHGTTMIFLGDHAAVGRVLQLPDPAADRGARRGVPAAERLQLLGVPVRRPVHQLLVDPRRRPGRRVVRLRAAHHHAVQPRPQHRLLGAGHPDPRRQFAGRGVQLHHHDHQHAGARHARSCACRCSPGWRSSCSSCSCSPSR